MMDDDWKVVMEVHASLSISVSAGASVACVSALFPRFSFGSDLCELTVQLEPGWKKDP